MKSFIKQAFSDNKGRASIKRILGTVLCVPVCAGLIMPQVPVNKMEVVAMLIVALIVGTVAEKFSKHAEA